jgi:hypothetical protein
LDAPFCCAPHSGGQRYLNPAVVSWTGVVSLNESLGCRPKIFT